MKNRSQGIVYSTDRGKMCPDCGEPIAACRCERLHGTVPGDGIVRISRETKGRKGKGVTLITGIPLVGEELKQLAKQLKKRCSTGGSTKNGTIELQGDHRDFVTEELGKKGWKVKRSGGR